MTASRKYDDKNMAFVLDCTYKTVFGTNFFRSYFLCNLFGFSDFQHIIMDFPTHVYIFENENKKCPEIYEKY